MPRDPDFAAGDVDTGLIARKQEALTAAPAPDDRIVALAVLAAARSSERGPAVPGDPWAALSGYEHFHPLARQVTLAHGQDRIAAAVTVRADGRADILLAGREQPRTIDLAEPMRTALWPGHVSVFAAAQSYGFAVPDPFARSAEAASQADTLRAPMPGLVKIVRVAKGDAVTKGQPLLMLEAMKMEHTIAAPHDGVIAEIVAEGAQVTDGTVLVRFVESAGDDPSIKELLTASRS